MSEARLSVVWPAALATLCLCIPSPARAQSTAMAETLFREGQELLKAGKVHEACEKLSASYELDPALGALLNLARCHEQEGKLATAWTEYASVARKAAAAGNQKNREEHARGKVTELEPKLNRLTIEVSERPAGLEVRLNEQVIPTGALGSALPIDPGAHRLEVKASGRKAWASEVAISPDKKAAVVKVPPLAAVANEPDIVSQPKPETTPPPTAVARDELKVAAPAPAAAEDLSKEAPKPATGAVRTAGFAVGGVALAVAAAGGISHFLSLESWDRAKKLRDEGVDQAGFIAAKADSDTQMLAAGILYGVAGAALLAGAVMAVVGGPDAPGAPTVSFAPLNGGGGIAFASGRF